ARAQLLGKGLGGDDDARLDQHLVDRAVEHRDQFLDLDDLARRVVEQQGVGARVEADAAARRQEAAGLLLVAATAAAAATALRLLAVLGQQRGDLLGVAVVDRDVFGDQLFALFQRDARVGLR